MARPLTRGLDHPRHGHRHHHREPGALGRARAAARRVHRGQRAHRRGAAGHDVSDPVQSAVRDAALAVADQGALEADRHLLRHQLDHCAFLHGRARLGFPPGSTGVEGRVDLCRGCEVYRHGAHLDRLGGRRRRLLRSAGRF